MLMFLIHLNTAQQFGIMFQGQWILKFQNEHNKLVTSAKREEAYKRPSQLEKTMVPEVSHVLPGKSLAVYFAFRIVKALSSNLGLCFNIVLLK